MFRIFKYICSIFLLIPILAILIFRSPFYLIRYFVAKVLIRCYPKVDKILTTRSSSFAGGRNPVYGPENPTSTLVTVWIVEGTLSLKHLQHLFLTRVIQPQNENGQFRKPEFQQYITKIWGFYCWKWEEAFDIEDHILMYNGKFQDQFQDGTKPVNADTVTEVMDDVMFECYKAKKSPWEFHLIHNYQEMDRATGLPAGPVSTAIIARFHHVLGDGFSLLKTLVFDLGQQNKLETATPNRKRPRSKHGKLLRALDFFLLAPYEAVKELVSAHDVNSWHVPPKQLKRMVHLAISHSILMSDLKEIKNLHKITFTTLIFECFTAAIRKFMAEAGFEVPEKIHCVTPLPAPGHPDKMRNHMTAAFTCLPVGESDYKTRLTAIEKNFNHIKNSTFPAVAFKLLPLDGALPSSLLTSATRNNLTTAIMSNFPGSEQPLSLDEHVISDLWFAGGYLNGNVGMGFSSLSYNGRLRIIVGVDEGIVPRSLLPTSKLIQYFLEEVDLLRNEALV